MPFSESNSIADLVRQSAPVDTSVPYDKTSLAGKTILITGGAAGFGAAFARHWAHHGAHIAVGDVDDAAGEALIAELRATTPGRDYHHYQHCDVTSWASQAAFFRAAADRSHTGTIDAVVPNAGIAGRESAVTRVGFEYPRTAAGAVDPDAATDADPLPPNLDVININLTGVLYSVHLALYWLGRRSPTTAASAAAAAAAAAVTPTTGDAHLLLVGSIAGLQALPGQALYSTSKHGVTGLFRALRATAHTLGNGGRRLRVNLLCPYFAQTGILSVPAQVLLAGGGLAPVADVVDAATRFMADEQVVGRALVVGPRMTLTDGTHDLVHNGDGDGADAAPHVVGIPSADAPPETARSTWECYADDFASAEVFILRYVRLINGVTMVRGWAGWARDMANIVWPAKKKAEKATKTT